MVQMQALRLLRRRLFSSSLKKPATSTENPTSTSASTSSSIPQAPNHPGTWSNRQMPRALAMTGPRFETVDLDKQPMPAAAIELVAAVPVTKVKERVVACDGGDGALGHPRIFINLDQGKPISCTYCGLRYEQEH